MRSGKALRIAAIAAVAAAAAFALVAHLAFRSALAARLDRAERLEAAVVRPAAAARLAAELAAHRLALVAEKESHAVAGALRRAGGEAALDAYRRAQGDPVLVEEARRAFAADRSPDAAADVAFLRAIRRLREQAAEVPSPARPDPPSSARRAGRYLLATSAAAAIAALLAFAAGRAQRRPDETAPP